MNLDKKGTTTAASGELPASLLLVFLAALLLLNAKALNRWADGLEYDSPVRAPALRALGPLCRVTAALRIDMPRNCAETLEKSMSNL